MARKKGKGSLQREPNGKYTLRCTINGKRVSKDTGTTDLAEAERFLENFMRPYVKDDAARTYENVLAAVESERQRAERLEDEKQQLKLIDAWPEYVRSPYRRDLATNTIEGKRVCWNTFVKWVIGDEKTGTKGVFPEVVEVRQVRPDIAEAYLDMMRIEHAASTYNNRLCTLREIFRVLTPKARCKVNPFDGIPLRADDSHSRRELTIEELSRLVTFATKAGESWKTLFAIGMYTGLRLGDCCTLKWSEVDIPRCIIQREPQKTKRYSKGKPVTIPIHTVLSEILRQTPMEGRTGYVLPEIARMYIAKNGRPEVSRQIKKIFTAAGIVTSVEVEGRKWKAPEATFHSLRHTFVSLSANAGVPLHIVQSIVGHESTAMTRHYYHENIEALTRAVSAIPNIGETGVSAGSVAYIPPAPPVAPQPVAAIPPPAPVAIPPPAPAAIPVQAVSIPAPEPAPAAPEPVPEPAEDFPQAPLTIAAEPIPVTNNPEAAEQFGGRGQRRGKKSEFLGEAVRLWGRRKATGVFEATMELVQNGGYRFLQELWDRGVVMSVSEALDAMVVYLSAKK